MQEKKIEDVWYSDGIRKLKVPRWVLEKMSLCEQNIDRNERGGILLGLVFKDHDEVVEFGKPAKSNKSKYFSFIRRKNPAQKIINDAWNQSGGYIVYLGEWHTHPGSDPFPSGQDKIMIEKVFRTTRMEIDYLYLIIAGANKSYWIGRQDNKELKTLKPISWKSKERPPTLDMAQGGIGVGKLAMK